MTTRRTVLKGGVAAGAGALVAPTIIGVTSTPAFAQAMTKVPIVIDDFTTASVDNQTVDHLGGERFHTGGIIIGGGTFAYDGVGPAPLAFYGPISGGPLAPFAPALDLSACSQICAQGLTNGFTVILRDNTGLQASNEGFVECLAIDALPIDLTNVVGMRIFPTPGVIGTASSLVAQ